MKTYVFIEKKKSEWTNVVRIKNQYSKIIFVYSFCTKFGLSSFNDTDNGHLAINFIEY